VMEVALKTIPARCLLTSVHLEAGRENADRLFGLATAYNAAVLCLTIDERGMAQTATPQVEVPKRLFAIATEDHGLRPEMLIFDPLTFTLATGDVEYMRSAIETLEGIRKIKEELPGVLTSLGISNVSFGFSPLARSVLNSVMLFHAMQAGLDMAIVNPAHIVPYTDIPNEQRQIVEDLIFCRKPEALPVFIDFFEHLGRKVTGEPDRMDVTLGMTPQERVHWRIVHRRKEGVEQDIDEMIASNIHLSRHECAVDILNNVLLPAMKEVGDKFGRGELILPFVLQSAEVMKKSVAYLEKYLEKKIGRAHV